jgi:hypothetical protein
VIMRGLTFHNLADLRAHCRSIVEDPWQNAEKSGA